MKNIDKINTARKLIRELTDEELLEELDEVAVAASQGDRQALLALSVGLGPVLLAVAREELGPAHAQDAGDVLQALCMELMEERFECPRIRGGGLPWLKRITRALARRHLRALAVGGGTPA